MRGKLLFFVGLGVGYVLGTRAGRPAYERIVSRAQGTWNDPRVQEGVHEAEEIVKENAPVVAEKAKEAASSTAAALKRKAAGARNVKKNEGSANGGVS